MTGFPRLSRTETGTRTVWVLALKVGPWTRAVAVGKVRRRAARTRRVPWAPAPGTAAAGAGAARRAHGDDQGLGGAGVAQLRLARGVERLAEAAVAQLGQDDALADAGAQEADEVGGGQRVVPADADGHGRGDHEERTSRTLAAGRRSTRAVLSGDTGGIAEDSPLRCPLRLRSPRRPPKPIDPIEIRHLRPGFPVRTAPPAGGA
jgi:hypothetical protein